jgi:phage recombination protein Bet
MAQPAQAMTIAPRVMRPTAFNGTDAAWRVLCDLYPAAETPEIILAVVDYCGARKLDPFKKPVHIVPIYNSKLRRKVQVVMQGINEIETTAHRSGVWAGMDLPAWGPDVEKTFRGQFENDDGTTRNVDITLTFPVSCAVTVWRIVKGQRQAFTEQLYWIESYGRAGFRSEVPNTRWTQAPRQMLHKCTKAAVLRAAFPEDVTGYAAEEMEDREIDDGGMTIDGKAEQQATTETARDRQAREAFPPSDAQRPQRETPQLTGEGDFRIAMPDGGFAYTNSIDWLAKWDQLIVQYRDKPNDLRAIRTLNVGPLRAVADISLADEIEVSDKLARILDRSPQGGRARR